MKKRTFVGKIWREAAKGAVKEIPYVGGLIHNKIEKNEAPEGTIDKGQLIGQLIVGAPVLVGVVIVGGLVALALSFNQQAEEADFANDAAAARDSSVMSQIGAGVLVGTGALLVASGAALLVFGIVE